MSQERVEARLAELTAEFQANPSIWELLTAHWDALAPGPVLAGTLREAADELGLLLPDLLTGADALERVRPLLADDRGSVLLAWLDGAASRPDVVLAPLLVEALKHPHLEEPARAIAVERVIQGPLRDALASAPLVGRGDRFDAPELVEARARMELLIWDAGASAMQVPELGPWIWGSNETFDAFIGEPSRGSLRGRVLAARCLEISIEGMPAMVDQMLLGRSLQALQPLILHPEGLVSTHAARGLGLIAGKNEHLEGMLLDWIGGEVAVLRERGMTAFVSLPGRRIRALRHSLMEALNAPGADDWALRAAAAGTPVLFREARDVWDEIAGRILEGRGGAKAARELASGLGAMWRAGTDWQAIEAPLATLRQLSRIHLPPTIDGWRDWLAVYSATDPIDGAERDPFDVELGLENLARQAARYDDEEADARAARLAKSILPNFQLARDAALGDGSPRSRAAGMNALEGCARSMALRLWGPQLATSPHGDPTPEPDMTATWEAIASAPAALLEVVKERREEREGEADAATLAEDVELEIMALRLGGYALDACGTTEDLGPDRGPTAHATCQWLRQLDGVADGSRALPPDLATALSSIFWRLVDTTRGSALGEIDDIEWLGPFAAWWALVIDRPEMLKQLATALPMIKPEALEACTTLAQSIRDALEPPEDDGAWSAAVTGALGDLKASSTELAVAIKHFARNVAAFADISGRSQDIEFRSAELVRSASRLQAALADPVKALHPAAEDEHKSLPPPAAEGVPRTTELVVRAIRTRAMATIDVWLASLGPVTAGIVEGAIQGAISRTPPPPPSRKVQVQSIEGYELVKPLGEGGVGKVWLVRKPGADRLFVLKVPKREALTNASETEKKGLLASFVEEANALAGLYHPNVANIIDRGVVDDVPFLVLELLIGCDLEDYSKARLLTLPELRQIVLDSCAGLSALHGARLVHRDIKPANLWLRLPLESGTRFDPSRHRDPSVTRPLSTVVIDFGMVRPMTVSEDAAGRFVAGTPGYIAPDQVLDPVELDGRADVYALAGTVYNVTTGRSFFDEAKTPRDRIFAHMQQQPLEDASLLKGYPAELVKLMRAATAKNPKDRPFPMEFGRAFEQCL